MFHYFVFCSRVQSAEPWPDRWWLSKVETWNKDYAPKLHHNRGEASRMLDDDGGNKGARDLNEGSILLGDGLYRAHPHNRQWGLSP